MYFFFVMLMPSHMSVLGINFMVLEQTHTARCVCWRKRRANFEEAGDKEGRQEEHLRTKTSGNFLITAKKKKQQKVY